jgi:hypothetical protein
MGMFGSRCETLHRVRCASLQRMCCQPEEDAHSTFKCSTNTCALQNCRFHYAYHPEGIEREWSDIEPDEMDSETGEHPTHRDWDEVECCYTYEMEENYGPDPPIELRKARAVFNQSRWIQMCEGCEETFTAIYEDGPCKCDMWSHFVGRRWLCIPCFFVEETEAYKGVQWKAGADGKAVCRSSRLVLAHILT